MKTNLETLELLKDKRRSFSWRTSYGRNFTGESRAVYSRSAAILFPRAVRLTDKQVLSVYDHAIAALELQMGAHHCAGCGEVYFGDMDAFYASHACPNCPTRSYGLHEEDGETGADCREADPQGWS